MAGSDEALPLGGVKIKATFSIVRLEVTTPQVITESYVNINNRVDLFVNPL